MEENKKQNKKNLFDEEAKEKITNDIPKSDEADIPHVASISAEADTTLEHDVKIVSPGRMVSRRFFRSRLSVIGLCMIIFLFMFSFLGPLFSPYGEVEDCKVETEIKTIYSYRVAEKVVNSETGETETVMHTVYEIRKTVVSGMSHSSWKNWLGTDTYGYDVMTRLMYGGRISLSLSFIVMFLELLLGVLLGGVSGYFGGWLDNLIMRLVDILNCLPGLPLLLIASSVIKSWGVPGKDQIYWLMGVLTIFSWGGTARLVRGQILMFRNQEFMVAAEATGLSAGRKIFKHLIPNVMPQLIVSATLGLGSTILYEATLSYLGLGVQFPYAAWGSMISKASPTSSSGNVILQYYPEFWVPAGMLIVLAVLGFNFVGDGLRDAFDPKSKR